MRRRRSRRCWGSCALTARVGWRRSTFRSGSLVGLFVAEVIFFILLMAVGRRSLPLQITVFLLVTLTGCAIGGDRWLPWSFDVALAAQGFMFAGFQFRKLIDSGTIRPRLHWLPLLTVITIASLAFNQHVDMNYRTYGDWFLYLLCGTSGSLMVVWISAALARETHIARVLGYVGRNSIMILVLQFPIGFMAINVANELSRSRPFVMRPYWWLYALAGILLPLLVAEILRGLKTLRGIIRTQVLETGSATGD